MKPVSSEDARRRFRDLLDDVAHRGEHVTIMRYNTPAAVIVPIEWHERAEACIAAAEGATPKDR